MKAYTEWGKQKLVIDSIEPTHYVRNFMLFSLIKKLSKKSSIKNICEIGCGVGNLSARLGKNGFKVDAFDLDENAVELARKYNSGKNVNFFSKDVLKLNTKQKFDLVLAVEVFEHIKDDVNAIKSARNLLRDGGFLLITVPINEKYRREFDDRSGHIRRYDVKGLKNKLNGFKILKSRYFNYPLLWLWYFNVYILFSNKKQGSSKKLPFYAPLLRIFNKLFLVDLLFNNRKSTNIMILAQKK
jgi:SAM-dependent methyltransferase|tara:strand:+ start:7507 stop:8232 length:726 start_codon:yes stop_codon:yes gene_type:complete